MSKETQQFELALQAFKAGLISKSTGQRLAQFGHYEIIATLQGILAGEIRPIDADQFIARILATYELQARA